MSQLLGINYVNNFNMKIKQTINQLEAKDEYLLMRFNKRDPSAYGEVYNLYYNELYHFASRLFYDTEIDVDDVIHDIFLNIWELNNRCFDTLLGIKGYIYVCIKNKLKNYLKHNKHVNNYNATINLDDLFVVQVAESEIFSILSYAVDLLPEECSKVFKLHVDGWEVKDIAKFLSKSESTVYKQKQKAISILKKRFNKRMFFLIGVINMLS